MKKNRIILYPPEEISFSTHGLGVLSDAIACDVSETINGEFELFMAYPIDGALYSRLDYRYIIYAKPSPDRGPEPFRIYRISTPVNGRVKVYARHLSYDADGIPVSPFTATDTAGALSEIKRKTAVNNPFRIVADVNSEGEIKIKRPGSLRAVLIGQTDSLLSTYGGEYLFSGFNVRLCERRGSDHGYKIRYGVNLIDANQERNCASVYTGVYPYFYEETDGTETIVELNPKIINLRGNFGFTRILPLDLSSEFSDIPTEEQLHEAAEAYIAENDLGVPEVNITVEFAPLRQFEEYAHLAFLESVELGDTVGVYFEKIGISAKARVISTLYDALLDRYKTVTIGDEKHDIVGTLFTLENSVKEAIYKADSGIRSTARLTVMADELGAQIKGIADWSNQAEQSIAELGLLANEQGAQISAKVSKKAGSTSSFGWDLSLNEWRLSSNGMPVFVVTKGGARVVGHIEASSGRIGDFSVTKNGLTYGTVYIGTDIVGFGKKPEDIEQYETVFATSIDRDGYLVSSKTKLYNPNLYGNITIGGSPAAGHAVKSAVPFILPALMVGGNDLSTHESRIAALEAAIGGGGGGVASYSVYIVVKYYDEHGSLVRSNVDVNGTYPVGTSFDYPETEEIDGITYVNTNGGMNIVVTNADVNATVIYEEESDEEDTSIYTVSIDVEYNMLDGSTQTVHDVRGLYRSGATFSYPKETTYGGKSFVSTTGEAVDFVVVASDISETVTYDEQSAGAPEFDVYMSVGDTVSYPYGSIAPEITIDGSGLTYYDDGGVIEFVAESTGQGKVTIKESDMVLEEWTYIIT